MANSKALLVFALVFLLVLAACQSFVQDESPITGRAITTTNVEEKTVTSPVVNIEVKPAEDDPPISTDPDPDAVLPQNHEWQIILRNYLATFEEADFEIPLDGEGNLPAWSVDMNYFNHNGDVHKGRWLSFYSFTENVNRVLPTRTSVIRAPPENFLLSNIENDGTIYMYNNHDLYGAGFYYEWDYSGNPYYSDPVAREKLRNRLVVSSFVHLIQHPEFSSFQKRGDIFGGHMVGPTRAYYLVKDSLPQQVKEAAEEALESVVDIIEERNPWGVHADMDLFVVQSCWYIYSSIENQELRDRCKSHVKDRLLARHFHPAGYVDHGDGFDVSYQGMSNNILVWAWLAGHEEWEFLDDVMDRTLKLRAHISLPEMGYEDRVARGRSFVSPQHFATTTEPGTWNEQQFSSTKYIGYAMASDWHKFLLLLNSHVHYYLDPWPDEDVYFVQSRVSSLIDRINSGGDSHRPELRNPSSDAAPSLSIHGNHYIVPGINMGLYFSSYPYFYDEMQALIDANSPLTQSPFLRNENFVRSFPEVDMEYYDVLDILYEGQSGDWNFWVDFEQFKKNFVVAKYDDYATIIHTGRLSHWGNQATLAGLSGGSLSAFWTNEGGPMILSRTQSGPQVNPSERTNRWNDPDGRSWRLWGVHAISGETNDGGFSSAGKRFPDRNYTLLNANEIETTNNDDAVRALIEVSGGIGASYTWPGSGGGQTASRTVENNNVLPNGAVYHRTFDVRDTGVIIESKLNSDGTQQVGELWELIPVFLGERQSDIDNANTAIYLEVNSNFINVYQNQVSEDTSIFQDVTRVRIERFEGVAYIIFSEPRTMKISSTDYPLAGTATSRNIMVDLLGGSSTLPVETSVKYIISPYENAVPS